MIVVGLSLSATARRRSWRADRSSPNPVRRSGSGAVLPAPSPRWRCGSRMARSVPVGSVWELSFLPPRGIHRGDVHWITLASKRCRANARDVRLPNVRDTIQETAGDHDRVPELLGGAAQARCGVYRITEEYDLPFVVAALTGYDRAAMQPDTKRRDEVERFSICLRLSLHHRDNSQRATQAAAIANAIVQPPGYHDLVADIAMRFTTVFNNRLAMSKKKRVTRACVPTSSNLSAILVDASRSRSRKMRSSRTGCVYRPSTKLPSNGQPMI